MPSTEVFKIVRELQHQGWIVKQTKHLKCFPPDKTKQIVIIAVSPSDRRALMNIKSQLRRSGANI